MDFFQFFSDWTILFLDWSVNFLQNVPWYSVLIFAFFITFLENIFPPAPCDTILVFMGTLVGISAVGFLPLAVFSTLGSLAGFGAMFWIGLKFGTRVIESPRFSFINSKSMEKPERWFKKYGYFLIVANRFLAGTRAGIAFFAGMTKLDINKSLILSAISGLFWNSILIGLGFVFADNIDIVKDNIKLYGKIAAPIIIIALAIGIFFWLKNSKNTEEEISPE